MVLLQALTAYQLVVSLGIAVDLICSVAAASGFSLNMKAGKTEAVLSLRGVESAQLKQELAQYAPRPRCLGRGCLT